MGWRSFLFNDPTSMHSRVTGNSMGRLETEAEGSDGWLAQSLRASEHKDLLT